MKYSVSCILVLGLVTISQIMADPVDITDPVDWSQVVANNSSNATTTQKTPKTSTTTQALKPKTSTTTQAPKPKTSTTTQAPKPKTSTTTHAPPKPKTSTTTKAPTTKSSTTTKAPPTTKTSTTTKAPPKTKPTTHAPTTTAKPAGTPRYSWKEDGTNTTCILLQANINILYNVTAKKKTTLMNITVPRDPEYDGKCTDDADGLFLSWPVGLTTYTLEMYFNKTSSDYSMSKIAVGYKAIATGSVSGSTTVTEFQTDLDSSYNCTKGVDIDVGKLFKVTMKDVRVQAFMGDKSETPNFSKTGTDCASSGNKTDAIVPIAVGCALAAMVVIVLIGYCIGRRRTMAGYQSMSS